MTNSLKDHRFTCALLSLLVLALTRVSAGNDWVFTSFDASNGLADNSAQVVKCTETGRMVVSTIGHINFFDGANFTHIDPSAVNAYPLPKYLGHYRMYFDNHEHIWLKDKNMVTCVNLLTERFVDDAGSIIRRMGMTLTTEDLFADDNRNLWFLSGQKLYCPELGKVMPVAQKAELQDVNVYGGTMHLQFYANSVVAAYDMKTGRHLFDARALPDSIAQLYTKSSVVFACADKYYQIRNGDKESVLLCFDVRTRQWQQLLHVPYHLNNMATHLGRLYVASEFGYWTYDFATSEFEYYEELNLRHGRKLKTDINTIAFDKQGGMWVGTERRGLLYAKPYLPPFQAYSWDEPESRELYMKMEPRIIRAEGLPRHTNCRYVDSRGWIWTGTYTGLILSRDGGNTTRVYTRKDGLMNEMIHCVTEDDRHNMWVGTSYGISMLAIQGDSICEIETYFNLDNVPNQSFVNGQVAKLDDGTIVMQALDNMVAFNPSHIKHFRTDTLKLYPQLVRLLVNGRRVAAGDTLDGKVLLDRAIIRTHELTVNYMQNSLSLVFSGLNYVRPIQTYYRYRVLGQDDHWHVLSHSNSGGLVDFDGLFHLPLFGLRPGRYVIEMQVSLLPDSWPVEPVQWVINVEEPWWRTTGVYLSMGLVLLLLLLGNSFVYNRNTRMRAYCNNEEEQILHKLRNFISRCKGVLNETYTPDTANVANHGDEETVSKDFEDFIVAVYPLFDDEESAMKVTMRQIADITGKSITEQSELLLANVFKSPRLVSVRLRLHRAAELLATTDMSIDRVAEQCGFVSPNFFIASFYHQYRLTPKEYRNSKNR